MFGRLERLLSRPERKVAIDLVPLPVNKPFTRSLEKIEGVCRQWGFGVIHKDETGMSAVIDKGYNWDIVHWDSNGRVTQTDQFMRDIPTDADSLRHRATSFYEYDVHGRVTRYRRTEYDADGNERPYADTEYIYRDPKSHKTRITSRDLLRGQELVLSS